jgi:hypothetical protein
VHDPLVVAHTIIRPWPQRSSLSATGSHEDGVRWQVRHHHRCSDYCRQHSRPHREGAFPWWKPGSYSRFWRVAGRDLYWPALVTVWHREPGGRDSGEVCPHYRRWQDEGGRWETRVLRGWRWHVVHVGRRVVRGRSYPALTPGWRVQVHPLQHLLRAALTRCAWCGGRDRKGDPVDIAHQWESQQERWWRGEPGLYHHDCSSVQHAHAMCSCPVPVLTCGEYGKCRVCGGFRAWRTAPDEADRLLAALPAGSRIPPDARPAVEAAWAARRAAAEAARGGAQ